MESFLIMIIRFVLGLMLVCGVALGQQENTIYATLLQNITAAPTVGYVPANASRGQAGHQVTLVFATSGLGGVCTDPNAVAYLQGSHNNVTFTRIGTNSVGVANHGITQLYAGQGAYPYIRINVFSFNTTDCSVSAYYSGTIVQSPITSVQGVSPVNGVNSGSPNLFLDARQINPVMIGGITENASIVPLLSCMSSVSYNVPATTTQVIVPALAGTAVHVCSYMVTGQGAAGTGQFSDTLTTDCTLDTNPLTAAMVTDPTLPSIVMGGGLGQVFTTALNRPLCFTTTGAGAGASVNVTYAQTPPFGPGSSSGGGGYIPPIPPTPGSGPVYVQGMIGGYTGNGSGLNVYLNANTTTGVGNALVVGAIVEKDGIDPPDITSALHGVLGYGGEYCTITANSPYAVNVVSGAHTYHTKYALYVCPAIANTSTLVHIGTSGVNYDAITGFVWELSNFTGIDQTPVGSAGNGVNINSTAANTTSANEILLGLLTRSSAATYTGTFSVPHMCPSPSWVCTSHFAAYEDLPYAVVSAIGNYKIQSTNAVNWGTLWISLK